MTNPKNSLWPLQIFPDRKRRCEAHRDLNRTKPSDVADTMFRIPNEDRISKLVRKTTERRSRRKRKQKELKKIRENKNVSVVKLGEIRGRRMAVCTVSCQIYSKKEDHCSRRAEWPTRRVLELTNVPRARMASDEEDHRRPLAGWPTQ